MYRVAHEGSDDGNDSSAGTRKGCPESMAAMRAMNTVNTPAQHPSPTIPNAYTDAPELHPNLILGSLHLLFWLFFHPSAWRNHVRRIDPELRPDFCLAELSLSDIRDPALQRLLISGYLVTPMLSGLLVGLAFWLSGE